MKRKIILSLLTVLLVCVSAVLLAGCDEGISGDEYASQVVTLYGDYSKKIDEITQALSKDQRVTATSLCDEASEIIDEIDALKPPVAFKDEHKVISDCCKKEKEKLELQKEYLDIAKNEGHLTDEENARIEEIQEKIGSLSLQSGTFYSQVQKIADKELEKQTDHEEEPLV